MMRVSASAADRLIDGFGQRLNGGLVRILDGARPVSAVTPIELQAVLAEVPLGAPAFASAGDGTILAHDMLPTVALRTGEAAWAQLVTASGDVIADLVLRAVDAQDVEDADVVLDRTDLQRGGVLTLASFSLRLPLT